MRSTEREAMVTVRMTKKLHQNLKHVVDAYNVSKGHADIRLSMNSFCISAIKTKMASMQIDKRVSGILGEVGDGSCR